MSRARQIIGWGILAFIAYVILTRPVVAADAAHALWRGVVNVADAVATFVDGLIPK